MKLDIEIDDPSRCYCAGQTIRGHVQLLSTTVAKIKGVTIKCIGRASTKWTSHRGRKGSKKRYERVVYFTSVQQHTAGELAVGSTKFPFTFQLPTGTPSSFNGTYGHIVYFIEAIVERQWKRNVHARAYFSFNAAVDLNTFPEAVSLFELYKEKTSFSFFCGRGLISARLNFPRSGFVGGQPLDFVLEVKNFSARNIPNVALTLMQECTFRVKSRWRTREQRVLNIEFPVGVPRNAETVFLGSEYEYKIPPLPPTGLGGCSIIDVKYYFKLELNLFAEAPIIETGPAIIGTIPLREMFANLLPGTEVSTATATAPAFDDIENQPAPHYNPTEQLYPDLPPPTYQEAIMADFGKADDNDQGHDASAPSAMDLNGNDKDGLYFVPKYTTYEWKS